MSDQPIPSAEEARTAAMLRTLNATAPLPDRAVLAALRERSLQAFESGETLTSNKQGSPMFSLMVRTLAALAASAVLAAMLFGPWSSPSVSGAPFLQVLENLREAESLHLQVVREDTNAHVWIRQPGLVRWEESPQKYQIAAGSRWWKVDETTNAVTTGDSPWFRSADQQVDLLELLALGVEDARPLLRTRPSEEASYEGRNCLVYRSVLKGKQGKLEVEAFVDGRTRELAGIVAHPAGARRNAGPPLAELKLVAVNEAVAEDKFVVAKTLSEDGRIGKVSDVQGIVVLRPMLAKRWTPVCHELLLKPGDWLRTELRGANAVKAAFTSEAEITLGPGSLLECISPTQARLHYGEAKVNAKNKEQEFTLLAPRDGKESVKEAKQILRVDRDEKLVEVKHEPLWLQGFEGTTNNQSLGSLIVTLPDGRNEPLTVGYHKVTVEIRDQIARTTIEESFANHTDSRLEGIFHFPLPQDASISGFGMWIGNDLIEADVVEKQRAREIYETILRERRDPGLLEWTSGNLFKARVFPIEAHSEKRVKIVYTQVLPLRGNRYRYSYALRSDLLQTRPLRELSLDVTVNSALPLKNIACSTHPARTQQTAHSGRVEFVAQEYTPTRDFEIVCEVDGKQSEVVVVPHRRGDDGYLLLQLTPPSGEGDFQRELLPDGQPLNVVLLCDTSASMDSEKRQQQAEFVATVLSSLSEADHFNLLAADVGTRTAFDESVTATADNIAKAQAFLANQISLGWTDLARAFDDVLKRSSEGSQVMYVGDGIVTAGETDPSSFVKRLQRMLADKKRVFHAVTVGNITESIVLRGIAKAGSGSVRSISGEQTPQKVALELLNEIAQPGLTDLNIEFRGVKVAAVYPERLPNLAAGTQQILVGRYLPEGKDQRGEILITGKRGKESVKYAARIEFDDAEAGNSFIPRLWARSHLDHLLSQGQSEAVRNEIIALSEEFHIITPYTSLLVLETDADRERFGVKRRYDMRDGERFFAEGKANANYELLQQQMKKAGDWRIALRQRILNDLRLLGRDPRLFQHQTTFLGQQRGYYPTSGVSSSGPLDSLSRADDVVSFFQDEFKYFGKPARLGDELREREESPDGGVSFEVDGLSLAVGRGESLGLPELSKALAYDFEHEAAGEYVYSGLQVSLKDSTPLFIERGISSRFNITRGLQDARAKLEPFAGRGRYYPDYTSWLDVLFPSLAPPAIKPLDAQPSELWSAEAVELSKALVRWELLHKIDDGLEIQRTSDTYSPEWNRRSSHNVELSLYSRDSWLSRTLDPEDHAVIEFADQKQRGAYSEALLLGRVRNSVETDLTTPALPLEHFFLSPLHHSQRYYLAKVERAGEDRSVLVLTNQDETYELRYTIDIRRQVVLKLEQRQDGKLSSTATYSDFVEVAGAWWHTKATIADDQGRKISETTYAMKAMPREQFARRMEEQLAQRSKVQFMSMRLPPPHVARQKTVDGSADFDDHLAMILHFAQLQQWDDVLSQVEAIEKQAADKPGVRWIRTQLLITMRRNDEARQRLLDEARKLADIKGANEIYLADFLLARAQSVATANELEEFVEITRPIYERQPAELEVLPRWQGYLLNVYENTGRQQQALALRKQMAEAAPWDLQQQIEYARSLDRSGQPAEAFDWLEKQLTLKDKWDQSDRDSLYSALADLYRNRAQWEELLQITSRWIGEESVSHYTYQQHLSALVFNDRLDEANAAAEKWLKEGQVERKLSPVEQARLNAAIYFAQGNGYNLSFYRMDPRWYAPLAQAARYFAVHPHHLDIVRRIFDYRFAETDEADQLRGWLFKQLQSNVDTLKPEQIETFVGWTLSGRMELEEPIAGRKQLDASEVPAEIWKEIAKKLRNRWSGTKEDDDRHRLGEALKSIYSNRFADRELLPFLRERLKTAGLERKSAYRNELFEAILARPWTSELEAEAFALLRELSPTPSWQESASATEQALILHRVTALYRLTDTLLTNRIAAAERALREEGNTHKLTRTELAAKKVAIRKDALAGLADQFGKQANNADQLLKKWLQIEQASLKVRLEQDLEQVEQLCWEILGEVPEKIKEDEAFAAPDVAQQRFLDLILHDRALTTVMHLAARRNADKPSIERVMKYLEEGIALGGEDALRWRATKFELLVALDQPDELEKLLREWIRTDKSTAPWRITLGILLAERGKVPEAIQMFEAAEKDHLLNAENYRMLSDWYLVADQRQAHERSRLEAFKQLPEGHLARMVHVTRERWYRSDRPLPSELDDETLLAYQALFAKSAQPEAYLWQLRELYAACRDFRLLQILPDALLGRSPQQIYPFLENLRGGVLAELHNEAAADEILARIAELRKGERTFTDLRALDLFEALIERKSSEVPNQPKPHAEACLAALKRAFDRKWTSGEPRLMASLLYNLGKLPDAKLAEEQLRELRELQKMTEPATRDHLLITHDLARLLFWSYGRRDDAIQIMQAEVNAWLTANDNQWPSQDNEVFGGFLSMLEGANRHATAETILQKQLKQAKNAEQTKWFEARLLSLYNHALEHKGEVSLGHGEQLLANTVDWAVERINDSSDDNQRYALGSQVVRVLDTGHRNKIPNTPKVVREFVFETIPEILKRQTSNYRNLAAAPISVIAESLGPADALRYIVERMEQYPQRLEITWDNAWDAFGYALAERRHEAAKLGKGRDLEPRVLKLVLAELKRDLETGQSRNQHLYHRNYSHFWEEKKGDFAKTAEQVYGKNKDSGRRTLYIAHYLWSGLEFRNRAIEMLLVAHSRGVLHEAGQIELVDYLHHENRYAESIPLLEALMAMKPDAIGYRTRLMIAYYETKRPEQLVELLASTDKHFHQQGRWTEDNIAALAEACLRTKQFKSAVGYYNEAISLWQRNNPAAASGDRSLSRWYQQLAKAHSGLGQTKEAVDAASAGIVAWGGRLDERTDALKALEQVLADAKDLDGFVKHLDSEAEKTGQDSAILRKAIGNTYRERSKHEQAIAQYKVSLELQPNDKEVHQSLIASYDVLGRKEEGTRQLLKQIDFDRHDLALYQRLAERMQHEEAQAQRAATSIVEAAPSEAENHTAYAEYLQKHQRWDEAITHWQKVAELRRLEPTGLLKLAEAQIHEKRWPAAKETIRQLQRTEWPARFNEVENQTRQLQAKLPK